MAPPRPRCSILALMSASPDTGSCDEQKVREKKKRETCEDEAHVDRRHEIIAVWFRWTAEARLEVSSEYCSRREVYSTRHVYVRRTQVSDGTTTE